MFEIVRLPAKLKFRT
ncbi:Protein of unknown function [Thermobacillus xylanilyticus]|uniref:Uncharacterized protein n=1 Tax=Thermobacillus xylanilyticus TaxID=76633 RepID=A0ABN7RJQ2_THEXY|nr:Protein of unknown function [Thermobacillus xylanilyticus]